MDQTGELRQATNDQRRVGRWPEATVQSVAPSETTTMKFSQLLKLRAALLRHTRLANLAFALHRLTEFGERINRAGLHGAVTLNLADSSVECLWPLLVAREGNQSVIEEHFTDEDSAELADILAFLHEGEGLTEFNFLIERLADRYLPNLRRELTQAGVLGDHTGLSPEAASHRGT